MSNANDFVIENGVLSDYIGPGGNVVIPEGVISINSGMFTSPFAKNSHIHSITIPLSMTNIDSQAFKDCKNLKTVHMHEGIEHIGNYAFDNCQALSEINIPRGIKSIGYFAFNNCLALSEINIPESVEHIGDNAFSDCKSLQDESGFVIVGNILFNYYGTAEELVLPTIKIIGRDAFQDNCRLKKVTIPESVERIESRAFSHCCNLESVVMPDSVSFVDETAFTACNSLKDKAGFSIVKNRLFGYTGNDKILIIPENVRYISDYVFSSMLNIEEVVLPNHTVEIGSGVFFGCSNLKSITLTTDTLTVSAKKHRIFGETGKTIELNLIERNGTNRRVVGAFRKVYYVQNWSYESDYLVPLTLDDIPYYDRMIAAGEFEGFKPNEQGRLKAMVLRLMEKDYPIAAEYREMFIDFLGGKFSKVIKMAEEDQSPAYIYRIIEAGVVTSANKKKITNALKKSSMEEINQLAEKIEEIMATAQTLSPDEATACTVERKYLDQLKAINAKAVLLKSGIEKLPDILLANTQEIAPKEYLQLILAEYISRYKKQSYALAELADEAASLLDKKSLSETVVTLYKNASPESIQRTFLPVVFRYADGNTVNELYHKYVGMKWMEQTIKYCLLFSDTREAMILAEKNKLLDRYAAIRGTNSDYIRYTSLYDFGFDTNGKKTYDLGSTKLEVSVNQNLTLSLYDCTTEKVIKSLPKKNADPAMYAAASSDFSEMKKNLKKAVNVLVNRLFQMYLNGVGINSKQWISVYFSNPVLRQIASLLVWSQGGKTFILTTNTVIDSQEQSYTLGEDDIFVAHPSEMSAEGIKSWQKYFVEHNLKQPFEQIWEPVVNFETVDEDRYNGIEIPAYRFKGQEKHGITFQFNYESSVLNIGLNDCCLEYNGGSAVRRHDLDIQGNLILGKFHAEKSRAANHIIGLLDKWTIYNRILDDDIFVIQLLHNATLAQISDYIGIATENNCTNVTAALLDYQNRTLGDFDPMSTFTLDL